MTDLKYMLLTTSCISLIKVHSLQEALPLVINTWKFTQANNRAWFALQSGQFDTLEALVEGCNVCEVNYHLCDTSVGYGGSPDENGETTLDAMVMDGRTMDVGSVGCLRNVKEAIRVAHAVMKYTKLTLLVGDLATQFALSLGFENASLETKDSIKIWHEWQQKSCQPNFWQNVVPDPTKHCGPYTPKAVSPDKAQRSLRQSERYNRNVDKSHHDTIGMLVVDRHGHVVSGTTTNGATHKIPGRVGDSPVAGAGSYAENGVGGAAATGDGDVMMRFLPSFHAVQLMGQGVNASAAAAQAIARIAKVYAGFAGAVVAVKPTGEYGAACHNFREFPFSVSSPATGGNVVVKTCSCSTG